jgi:hypothetical protein
MPVGMKSSPLLVLAVGPAACSAPAHQTGVASLVTLSAPSTSVSVEAACRKEVAGIR